MNHVLENRWTGSKGQRNVRRGFNVDRSWANDGEACRTARSNGDGATTTTGPNVNKAPQPHESPSQVVKPSVVSGGDATISVSLHPRLPWLFISLVPPISPNFTSVYLVCCVHSASVSISASSIYKQPIPYSLFCACRMVPTLLVYPSTRAYHHVKRIELAEEATQSRGQRPRACCWP